MSEGEFNQSGPVVVVIPTYNEALNILDLVRQILALRDDFEALVVDDQSPDGTWLLVRQEFSGNPRVHVRVRRGPRGRGLAALKDSRPRSIWAPAGLWKWTRISPITPAISWNWLRRSIPAT